MATNTGPQGLKEIFQNRQAAQKPPAYEWQDFALKIIRELGVPRFKKSAVFKVCKQYPKPYVEKALNETKELATGERWKYFFKVVDNKENKKQP